jgi:RimJ/RimL family protein N-acetyltransferase
MNSNYFESLRVRLRPFENEDASTLQNLLNRPEMIGVRYLPWGIQDGYPLSKKRVEKILEKWEQEENAFTLAAVLREEALPGNILPVSPALIGYAGVDWGWDAHCPFGFVVIDPQHRRQGFGQEVLEMLTAYVFETTPAHNFSSQVADWNLAGLSFARMNGFSESGRSRRQGMRQGVPYDEILVDILRPEWRQLRRS